MKKNLITFLLLFIALWLQAQDVKESIKADVEAYFSLLQEERISDALDYVHPDLIAMVGKEMFEMQYNQMLNNAQMKVSFGDLTINTVSDVFNSSEKGDFALVDYKFVMDYVINMDSEEAKNIMINALKGQFGEENFKQDGDNIQVTADRQMFVNAREDFEGWRILDYEKGMRMMLVGILSEEVLKHFGM